MTQSLEEFKESQRWDKNWKQTAEWRETDEYKELKERWDRLQKEQDEYDYEGYRPKIKILKRGRYCPNCGSKLYKMVVCMSEYESETYILICPSCGYEFASADSSWACFISTACVEVKGLPDDCEELKCLRKFRDEFVKNLPDGEEVLREYHEIAPKIIAEIEKREDKKDIYQELFDRIMVSVNLIKNGKDKKAFLNYREMVKELKKQYIQCDSEQAPV